MKIRFIHHYMQPGGVERQLYYLANGMAASHEVTVLLSRREGAFLDFLVDEVSVTSLEIPFKQKLQPGLLLAIAKNIRKDRPDVLISFHGSFHWLAVLAGRLAGVKVVCVFHGYLTRGLLWPAHWFFLQQADGLLAVSQSVRNSLVENLHIPPNKVAVVENGIDPANILRMSAAPLTAQEELYFEEGPVIISIGRLAKGKGFEDLLDAVAEIGEKFRLLIVGDGPERAQLEEKIANLRLSDRAVMLGNQVNPYKFLSKAAFFVLASETEGLPTVILEAMCLGVPCICTRYRGGTEGVISHRENGYLVDVKDPPGLRKAIELFLSPDSLALREALVKSGRELIERKYCLERYIGRYQEFLQSVTRAD